MKNKTTIIFGSLIIAIVFFSLGYWIKMISIPDLDTDVDEITADQRKEIITELQDKLMRAGYVPLPPEKVYTLENAEIKSIGASDDPYIIVCPSELQDPFENLFAKEIKVIFRNSTKIEKVIKNVDSETGAEDYIISELILDDLLPGEKVIIDSGENIIGKSQIVAESIIKEDF
jgi:hypothetical protein